MALRASAELNPALSGPAQSLSDDEQQLSRSGYPQRYSLSSSSLCAGTTVTCDTLRLGDRPALLARNSSSTSLLSGEYRLVDVRELGAPSLGARHRSDCPSSTSLSACPDTAEPCGDLLSASDSVCTYVECDTESVLHVSSASLGTDFSRGRVSSLALAPAPHRSSDPLSADAAFTVSVVGLRSGEPKLFVSDGVRLMECGDSRSPVVSLSIMQSSASSHSADSADDGSVKSKLLWCCASLACCFLG